MKVDPKTPETDVCQTSIDILKIRTAAWLLSQYPKATIWFPDDHAPYPGDASSNQTVDVVLFGGFFRRILESGVWPKREFRFWTLSHSVRNVLIHLIGFPAESIQVIPRYALFPSGSMPAPMPKSHQKMTWVVSGRLSAVKNISMILFTVSHLQKNYNIPIQLVIQGDFDNQIHPDKGRRDESNFEQLSRDLINRLNWTISPRILPKVSPTEWLEQNFENPVLLSFSTFMCEDFNVSLAQAQAKGWPCIVSDWGGHREATGSNIFKFSPSWIADSHEPEALIDLKAQALAAHLNRMLRNGNNARSEKAQDRGISEPEAPKSLGYAALDSIRQNFVEKIGPSIQLVLKNGIEPFADTEAGRRFFSEYCFQFSGPAPSLPVCVLTNDLNKETPQSKTIATLCKVWLVHCEENHKNLLFFSSRDLKLRRCLLALSQASQVAIPFSSGTDSALSKFLKDSVGQTAVCVPPDATPDLTLNEGGTLLCRVVSDSMEPIIPTGAILEVMPIDPSALKRFDIVVYFRNGRPTCHFVWHLNQGINKGQISIRSTKESTRSEPPLNPAFILGKVENYKIPRLTQLKILIRAFHLRS